MQKFDVGGKTFELPDEVVTALKSKKAGGAGSAPDVNGIVEKHPWTKPFAGAGLQLITSGSGFKYGLEVECQAGKVIETTSRYSGVDSVIPTRIDHKVSALRTYDYSGLPACTARMVKATSDLHQSHLCPAHKSQLDGSKKKALVELSKQLQAQAAKKAEPEAAPAE